MDFSSMIAPTAVVPEPSSLSSSLSNSSLLYYLDDGFEHHYHNHHHRPSSAPAMEMASPSMTRFPAPDLPDGSRRGMHRDSYPMMVVPPPATFSPLVTHPPTHARTKLFPRPRAPNLPFDARDRRGISPLDSQVSLFINES